jgi:hypothetical protein
MKVLKSILFLSFCSILFYGCQKDDIILNKVPVANAGPSQTITLPINNITLTGTGADPDGQIVAYLWSQVSGASTTSIANPGAASTTVSGFVAGNYLFQLMVTDDDGATGVDTISIKVNPAPEQTLTLQPANNPFDVTLGLEGTNNISGNSVNSDIPILSWTRNGNQLVTRSLMKFDLSTIPQTATIVSANLYLYSHPSPTPNGNFTDPNFGTNNSMILQRATTDWTTSTLTWFNQPSGASQNQVNIPHTSASSLDLNLDVTALVSTMVTNNANYGFLIKLQNEVNYTSRIFVSSYNTTNAAKRPKLVIVYR